MEIQKILMRKRDGEELTELEIKYFIKNVTSGNLTNSQIGAMLMAIFIRGLTTLETIKMTEAMIYSGDVFEWNPEWADLVVDKHSTGGVGDKISVVLAPTLAACGLKVPMLSGRSLAFTGGTLNKLESIPGFNVHLSKSELEKCLESAGCFISGTTDNICPADRILYERRNETCTIDYFNLITCSVISKKAVEGIKNLILDIKVGQGSFMKDMESARSLAKQLVNVSKGLGIKTKAIITKMDYPLGKAVGNSLEIIECLNLMKGIYVPHIQDLVTIFGGNLLEMSGKAKNLQHGKEMIEKSLENGKALQHFYKMLINQGVKEETAKKLCYGNENESPIQSTKYQTEIVADKSGWIEGIDAFTIGDICHQLTSGSSNNNEIDLSAGVHIKKIVGEFIERNETWLIVHHSTTNISPYDQQRLEESLVISNDKANLLMPENNKLVLEYIE